MNEPMRIYTSSDQYQMTLLLYSKSFWEEHPDVTFEDILGTIDFPVNDFYKEKLAWLFNNAKQKYQNNELTQNLV